MITVPISLKSKITGVLGKPHPEQVMKTHEWGSMKKKGEEKKIKDK